MKRIIISQDHYQLFLNHSFNDYLSFNTALFLSKGKGYYEQYKGVAAETAAGSTSGTHLKIMAYLTLYLEMIR
ncbi:MAG: hypothetical protein WKG06_42025 [Segetibacter sp.]